MKRWLEKKDKERNVLIIQSHTPKIVAILTENKWLNYKKFVISVVLIFKILPVHTPLVSFLAITPFMDNQKIKLSHFPTMVRSLVRRGEDMCSLFLKNVILFWMHITNWYRICCISGMKSIKHKVIVIEKTTFLPLFIYHIHSDMWRIP
jgi:hypothetical protein